MRQDAAKTGLETGREANVETVLDLAAQIFRVLLPTVPREVMEADVTMVQLKAMLLLYLNQPMRMSELATGLGVTLATATGLVDRLVDRGVASREGLPEDRRVVLVRLTASGDRVIGMIWSSSRERMAGLLGALDATQLETLAGVLRSMLEAAGD
jgi:DNA-binding MarR family transcriptional regulator